MVGSRRAMSRRAGARRAMAATLSVGMTAALLTSGSPSHARVSGRELHLTFDGRTTVRNAASPELDTSVVSRNGGTVKRVAEPDRAGGAIRLPAYRSSQPPLAGLTIADRRGVDDLDPGHGTFTFGAAFTLDARSQGSRSDNGNNLLQRGLHGDRTQYKLQVDNRRPSCRIKGRSGAVTVTSPRQVGVDAWYRVACTRHGSTVTLVVTRLAGRATWTHRRSGATGSMTPASRSVPMSVGVKVTNSGALLARASDQFNGRVDDVFLNIR